MVRRNEFVLGRKSLDLLCFVTPNFRNKKVNDLLLATNHCELTILMSGLGTVRSGLVCLNIKYQFSDSGNLKRKPQSEEAKPLLRNFQ